MTGRAAGPEEREAIAIVGMGCRFPGGVRGPESLWRALDGRMDAITRVPANRFDVDHYLGLGGAGGLQSPWGGFVEEIEGFDARFFGISPREAERLDPQHRFLLESAWDALEDAGLPLPTLRGSRTGVFLGLWLNDYEARLFADPSRVDFHMTLGSGRYSAAGRISHLFGLEGPSLVVDTACSSSLVAIDLACRSLRSGETTLAMAGGANAILQPHITIAYSGSGMMAPDGRCKFGDHRADGYVRSEGSGIVVLKTLSRALEDGDPVYATIRGGAVNNDGRSGEFLTTPSQAGQEEMLRLAYADARVDPGRVSYVEAHGTGTRTGDPVEVGAVGAVLGTGRPPGRTCRIGSLKSNFGHMEGAAGVAGVMKAALALERRTVPGTLHFERANPAIPWSTLGVSVAADAAPLDAEGPVWAGVSSFGISGTNAHLVLETPPAARSMAVQPEPEDIRTRPRLIPFSAATPDGLSAMLQTWATWLDGDDLPSLEDVAWTLGERRTHLRHRVAFPVDDLPALGGAIRAALASRAETPGDPPTADRIIFVFPGQGSQWTGMARELLATEPDVRRSLEACEEAMAEFVDWSLMEQLGLDADAARYRLDDIDVLQPTLLAIEIALSRLWRSWGVEPDGVVGHSMGEVAAAHVAGALTLADAMRVICSRSRILRKASGRGGMALVELDPDRAAAEIAGFEGRVSVAVSNSPRSTVLSGDPGALDEILARLEERGVFCRAINVDVASHSPQMDPLGGELLAALEGLAPGPSSLPFHSTVRAKEVAGETLGAGYWMENLREPVRFADVVQGLLAGGATTFIEMSPHPILTPAIDECIRHAEGVGAAVPSLRRGEPEQTTLLEGVAELFARGHSPRWGRINPSRGKVVRVPLYPWQRERYWHDAKRPAQAAPGGHPLVGTTLTTAGGMHLVRTEVSLDALPFLGDHQVRGRAMLPASAMLEVVFAAARVALGASVSGLDSVAFEEGVVFSPSRSRLLQVEITTDRPGTAAFRLLGRSTQSGGSWVRHASGVIVLGETPPVPAPDSTGGFPEAALVGTKDGTEDGTESPAEHYGRMSGVGLDYGEAFRRLGGISWSGREAFAELSAHHGPPGSARFHLDPAVLDAAFQLLLGHLLREHPDAGTPLPVALGSFRLWRSPSPGGVLRARVVLEDSDGGLVQIVDEAGGLVAEARGLRFHSPEPSDEERGREYFETAWRETPTRPRGEFSGRWLLFGDPDAAADPLCDRLAERIVAEGGEAVRIRIGDRFEESDTGSFRIDPSNPAHFVRLVERTGFGAGRGSGAGLQGVVYGWGMNEQPPPAQPEAALSAAWRTGPEGLLHLVQAVLKEAEAAPPRLCVLTRGARILPSDAGDDTGGDAGDAPSGPDAGLLASPLWGLVPVIGLEHPELRPVVLDLDPAAGRDEAREDEVDAVASEMTGVWDHDRIAIRGGRRFACVLTRASAPGATTPEAAPSRPSDRQAIRLEAPAPGVLDRMRLRAHPRVRPGPGEVEVEVAAAGLNFIDVLKAMGTYPGLDGDRPPALGAECAGHVAAVGDEVAAHRPGDAVVVLAPSLDAFSLFSTHVVVPEEFVFPLPAGWTMAQAATLPVAFLTAQYALFELGRLEPGERVLVHSAAGGVGLAAVQLARAAGAEVLATAGTPEKRAFLRGLGIEVVMDSRTLAFGREVMEATGGQGVDVVLNALAGPAIEQGLACLAPDGRFIEIGKRDIHENAPIGLGAFRRGITLASLDLSARIARRPDRVLPLLRELLARASEGRLTPLPVTTVPFSRAPDAFREMARGTHVGRICVAMDGADLPALPLARGVVRPDRSYLVTGGLGGLGLLSARHLAKLGARHLALLGRSAASPEGDAAVSEIRASGVEVRVFEADVSDRAALARELGRMDAEMPALAGIIHSAGVLSDGTVLGTDAGSFGRPMRSKVLGAWNLNELSEGRDLDFFVLFSSATALLGTPGQGGYAAGNAFLDALAAWRHRRGLPATSINWGPWKDVGLAAAQEVRGERMADRGLGGFPPERGLEILAEALGSGDTAVVAMKLDPAAWTRAYPSASAASFLEPVLGNAPAPVAPETPSDLLLGLRTAGTERRRRAILEEHLRGEVARVLRLRIEDVPKDLPFQRLGMDSLMGLELRNRLEAALGVTLSATGIWNYPTPHLLSGFLLERIGVSDDRPEVDDLEAQLMKELREVDELLRGS